MKLLFTLAWRNIWRNKRRTLITVSSVFFACLLAIVMISMAKGLQEQMIETSVRNSTGYLQIQDPFFHDEPSMDNTLDYSEELKVLVESQADLFEYTVPRLQGFALAAQGMHTKAAMVNGVVFEKENRMSNLGGHLTEGAFFDDDSEFVVLAEGLAQQLELSIGDTLILLGQGYQGMTSTGKYVIGGIVTLAMPELNNMMVYMPLKKAQWFFAAPDRLSNLIFMVDDERTIDPLIANLSAELDPEWYVVKKWDELLPDMIGLLEFREAINTFMAWILYLVVAFGIFGTILTMLYERMREFGIMMSVGMKRIQLATIVFLETLFISFLGVIAGIVASLPLLMYLKKNPIRFSEELSEYMLEYGMDPVLPFSMHPAIFSSQGITIFVVVVIIGIYAVQRIFRLNILEAARN